MRCILFALLSFVVPLAAQTPRHGIAVREISIDGAANHFSRLDWVGVRSDSVIVASFPEDLKLRFFGIDGKPILSIGKDGEGKGQFRALSRIGWTGDTLWIRDLQLRRLTLIAPDLSVVRIMSMAFDATMPNGQVVPFPTAVGGMANIPVSAVFSDRSFAAYVSSFGSLVPLTEWHRPDNVLGGWIRFAPNGVARGLIGWTFPVRVCKNLQPLCQRSVTVPSDMGNAFAFADAATSGPDSGNILVRVMTPMGDTVFNRRYPFDGVWSTQAFADSVIEVDRRQRGTAPSNVYLRPIGTYTRTVHPPLVSVLIGLDRTIWVQLRATKDGHPWMVLEPSGELIGTVVVPLDTRIVVASHGAVWARTGGYSSQPESIARLRITWQ